jgi:peroxiredoxin
MNITMSMAARNIVLLGIFGFLMARLLLGCDRQTPPAPLNLGDTAPDFAAKDLDGKVVVLSSLGEGPVILRFFETNCRFCKADTPVFSEFYNKHRDRGLRILYVGSFYENEQSLRSFARELGTDFPVILDNGAKLADLYGIKAYPQTLLLGPGRKILAALLGGVGEGELTEILGKYL